MYTMPVHHTSYWSKTSTTPETCKRTTLLIRQQLQNEVNWNTKMHFQLLYFYTTYCMKPFKSTYTAVHHHPARSSRRKKCCLTLWTKTIHWNLSTCTNCLTIPTWPSAIMKQCLRLAKSDCNNSKPNYTVNKLCLEIRPWSFFCRWYL